MAKHRVQFTWFLDVPDETDPAETWQEIIDDEDGVILQAFIETTPPHIMVSATDDFSAELLSRQAQMEAHERKSFKNRSSLEAFTYYQNKLNRPFSHLNDSEQRYDETR